MHFGGEMVKNHFLGGTSGEKCFFLHDFVGKIFFIKNFEGEKISMRKNIFPRNHRKMCFGDESGEK